jgi:hypothetical protein
MRTFRFLLASFAVLLFTAGQVFAQAGSNNYRVPSDVQAVGGGDGAKSGNYVLLDTIGEGNISTGTSTNYSINAGYRQTTYLSLSGPATVNVGTIVGTGQQTGSGIWLVTTDATAGYSLSWQATAANMTAGSDSVAPFTPTTVNVPDTWTIAAADSEWGGRVSSTSTDTETEWGTDLGTEYWLNVSTTPRVIVDRATRTPIAGSSEKIFFRGEVGTSKIQPTGIYTVTVILTAVSL